jgi:type I restriction enzyme, S subunit
MQEIPKSWQLVEISDIAETTSGGTPSRTNPANYCGDIPWIKSGNLNDGIVSEADELITAQGLKSSAAKVFPPGTILIALYGATIGKLGILSIEASTNQAICGIFLCEQVSKKYLFYFLYFQRRDLIKLGQGGAQPNISQQIVRSIQIPLPPFNEQHRIVSKIEELFSELDAGIASLKTAWAQLKIYRQALLKHAFEGKLTDPWRKTHADQLESADQLLTRISKERVNSKDAEPPKGLGHIDYPNCWAVASMDIVTSEATIGLVRSAELQNNSGKGYSYIKMDRVNLDGAVNMEPEVFVSCSDTELERFRLRQGDMLFNTRNSVELVGKTGIISHEPREPAVYNNNLMRIRTIKSVMPEFLNFQMCSPAFRARMERIKKATTSVAAVYGKDLKPLPILVPSIAEQEVIVEKLGSVETVICTLEQEIATQLQKAEALRQSILKKAFSGQLVAQDPTDEPASVLLERIRAGREAGANSRKPQRTKK